MMLRKTTKSAKGTGRIQSSCETGRFRAKIGEVPNGTGRKALRHKGSEKVESTLLSQPVVFSLFSVFTEIMFYFFVNLLFLRQFVVDRTAICNCVHRFCDGTGYVVVDMPLFPFLEKR